jgi:hypothetical protein
MSTPSAKKSTIAPTGCLLLMASFRRGRARTGAAGSLTTATGSGDISIISGSGDTFGGRVGSVATSGLRLSHVGQRHRNGSLGFPGMSASSATVISKPARNETLTGTSIGWNVSMVSLDR